MLLHLDNEDILRTKSTTVDIGWHEGIVKSIDEKPAKTDQSTNWVITIIIREGQKFDGIPITDQLANEKAPGFAIKFLKAMGFKIEEGDFNLQKAVGHSVGFHLEMGEFNKQPIPKIRDFRPSKQDLITK